MRANPSTDLVFTVNSRVVKRIKYFSLLGSLDITDGGALEDVHTHIKKVNVVFIKLYPEWQNKHISFRTKICLFNTNGKSTYCTGVEHEKKKKWISISLQAFVK